MSTARKSSRIQSQPKAVKYEESSDDDELDALEPSSSKATLKRKRKPAASPPPGASSSAVGKAKDSVPAASSTIVGTKDGVDASGRPVKKLRGKRGILQQLAEMPLELLFEIFGKLDPIDLLNLSRTTKALRAILLRRSSADIWREALTNVEDLPPCPPDLNEAQWSNLLFGKFCYFCGRTSPAMNQTYAWEARVRGCFKCVLAEFPVKAQTTVVLARAILELIPSFTVSYSQGRRSDRGVHYHGATFHNFVETEKRLTNLEERKKWFDERKAEKEALTEHARLCERWAAKRILARAEEKVDLRAQREQALREKMEGLGFSSTLVDLAHRDCQFWGATVIKNLLKKDITDRVWASAKENVFNALTTFQRNHAKEERDQYLKTRVEVFQNLYQQYRATRPLEDTIIPIADLFLVPDVQAVVLEEPVDEPLNSEYVMELLYLRVPEYTEEWVHNCKAKLLELLKPEAASLGLDPEALNEESLELAAAIFHCSSCYSRTQIMHASRALFHSCASKCHSYSVPKDTPDDLRSFNKVTQTMPWNHSKHFKMATTCAQRCLGMLKKLDLDPATTTVEAMDALDPIFEKEVVGRATARTMLTWRGIALRAPDNYYNNSSDFAYEVLDEETSAAVRARFDEDLKRDRTTEPWSKALVCTHCRESMGPSPTLRSHLKEKHDIPVASDADVWIHPDRPNGRLELLYYHRPGSTLI